MQLGSVSCITQSINSHILLIILNTIIIVKFHHHMCHSQNAAPQQLAARSCVARCAAALNWRSTLPVVQLHRIQHCNLQLQSVLSIDAASASTPLLHHFLNWRTFGSVQFYTAAFCTFCILLLSCCLPSLKLLHCHLENWIHLLWCIFAQNWKNMCATFSKIYVFGMHCPVPKRLAWLCVLRWKKVSVFGNLQCAVCSV